MLAAAVAVSLAALAGTAQARVEDDVAGRTVAIALSGPGGTGTAVFTVNPGLGLVCYPIEVSLTREGDVPAEPGPDVGAAHIHVFPSGAIFIDLEAEFVATDGGFIASNCISVDREAILAIFRNPESFYVNVHTVSFPMGAVTGTFG
jgi:CHRD domain